MMLWSHRHEFDVSAMMHESLGRGELLDFLCIVRRPQDAFGLFTHAVNLVTVECYRQMKRTYRALSHGGDGVTNRTSQWADEIVAMHIHTPASVH